MLCLSDKRRSIVRFRWELSVDKGHLVLKVGGEVL